MMSNETMHALCTWTNSVFFTMEGSNVFYPKFSLTYIDSYVPSQEERRLFGLLDDALKIANGLHGLTGSLSPIYNMQYFFLTWVPAVDKHPMMVYFFKRKLSFGYHFTLRNNIVHSGYATTASNFSSAASLSKSSLSKSSSSSSSSNSWTDPLSMCV